MRWLLGQAAFAAEPLRRAKLDSFTLRPCEARARETEDGPRAKAKRSEEFGSPVWTTFATGSSVRPETAQPAPDSTSGSSQNGQYPGLGASVLDGTPTGRMNVAYASYGTVPSFRTKCT